jgi:hypothetical protein
LAPLVSDTSASSERHLPMSPSRLIYIEVPEGTTPVDSVIKEITTKAQIAKNWDRFGSPGCRSTKSIKTGHRACFSR